MSSEKNTATDTTQDTATEKIRNIYKKNATHSDYFRESRAPPYNFHFYRHYTRSGVNSFYKALGLTQPELVEKAGTGLRFVRDLEQGKKTFHHLH
ncbi:MAG: hypothetical protein HGB15_02135 [Chlorobaculum sp.]|nr:hypothetical protein [Chlorobaculum sp.]